MTAYELCLVDRFGVLISVNARLPAQLLVDAWQQGMAGRPFSACLRVRREVPLGNSRLDLLFDTPSGGRLWVETKSVTLVTDGLARFPDAPTIRGRRHVAELAAAARDGDSAALVFVIQRPDASAFAVNRFADPAFAAAVSEASAAGVTVVAYTCTIELDGIEIAQQVPVTHDGTGE